MIFWQVINYLKKDFFFCARKKFQNKQKHLPHKNSKENVAFNYITEIKKKNSIRAMGYPWHTMLEGEREKDEEEAETRDK